MDTTSLNRELGNIDLYLLDQILKGLFTPSMKILDAGCGEGRNLVFFQNNGYPVYGIDRNPDAIRMVRFVANTKGYDPKQFQVADLAKLPFDKETFDVIICSAVLHFAEDPLHFKSMIREMDRVLKQGGVLFIRMASEFGMEDEIESVGNGKYRLPDGSVRYLLRNELLQDLMGSYSFSYLEPVKTVHVENKRCMTNLILGKG